MVCIHACTYMYTHTDTLHTPTHACVHTTAAKSAGGQMMWRLRGAMICRRMWFLPASLPGPSARTPSLPTDSQVPRW